MTHDLRQAFRTLVRHPGFLVLSAGVLALGIGLNTALFSIVHAMLFRTYPVASSHELVSLYQSPRRQPNRPFAMSSDLADHLARHSGVFTGVTGHLTGSYALRAHEQVDTVRSESVLANYFDVLGVPALLGRTFIPAEDDRATADRAVVLSHRLWQRRFNADPGVVGQQVKLALWGQPELVYTIVGVAPETFRGISTPWQPTDLWVTFAQNGRDLRGRGLYSVIPIGRLKPGITLEQARAVISAQGKHHYYSRVNASAEYEPWHHVLRTDDVRTPFDPSAVVIPGRLAAALTLVVATVLLVAAANIAGILLARGVGRSGELAVRRVLGAGPLRLARQLLTESLLLAALGGASGVALAAWLLALFRAFTPSELALDVGIEPAVLVFALAVCVAAGLIVGLAPVVQAWRLDVQPWLSGGNVVVKPARRRLRHMITIPQIACSLALLLVAGAYVRSLLDLETTDPGYDVANVAVANPVLRPDPSGEDPTLTEGQRAERYAARTRRFYTQLLDRVRAVPGIADGALTARLPLSEGSAEPGWVIVSQDRFLSGDRAGVPGDRHLVSPGYFGTLGISLTSGRDFDERDAFGRRKAAIVSRELAARLWQGRDPIGQTVTTADTWNGFKGTVEWFDVVGVVEEVMPVLNERGPRPAIYTSLAQEWRPSVGFIVARGHGDSRTLLAALRTAVTSSDTFADVNRTATLQEMAAGILYPRRIAGAVLAISGGLAVSIALVGVYGVVSYSVAQRRGEIGVRIALGADRTDILRLVLLEGARIAAVGCVLGLLLGYAASRVSSSRNLALPPTDLTIMALTPLLLGLTVLFACYVPARRAGLLNPLDTLRR